MLQRIQYALRLIRDIYIYIFLFFIWGGWHKEITHNTQSWKVLSPNLTNKLDWDGLWDPTLGNVHVGHEQLHHRSVEQVHNKEWYFMFLQVLSWQFFVVFHYVVFNIFIYFLDKLSNLITISNSPLRRSLPLMSLIPFLFFSPH